MDSNAAILSVYIGQTLDGFYRSGFSKLEWLNSADYRLNDTLLLQQQNHFFQAVDFQCFWNHCYLCLCKFREYLCKYLYL